MSIRVTQQFVSRWKVFWATTYTFELGMFDEFWLRRLGDPPHNITVLVDFERLADLLGQLKEQDEWRLRRANRDYLLRGVRIGSGSFHPKTYFFGNEHGGVLLVGSGNLTLGGLEDGNEVFAMFSSSNEEDRGMFAAWRDWIARLVAALNDHTVTRRWSDALSKTSWLHDLESSDLFVSNWDESLISQLARRVEMPVTELHVTAPFYDREAEAFGHLLRELKPESAHIYFGRDASVDGESLRAVLDGSERPYTLHQIRSGQNRFEFIHAKLIGVISADHGWLLSGSANLSRAALLNTVENHRGNVESAIIAAMPAKRVRQAFIPPGYNIHAIGPDALTSFEYHTPEVSENMPVSLLSAARNNDGYISITISGEMDGPLYLAHHSGRILLRDGRTTMSIDDQSTTAVVWLENEDGQVLSNRVVIEHQQRLNDVLQDRQQTSSRPSGFNEQDLNTPVGEMLERLHRECIFEIDETPAAKQAQRIAGEDEADSDFWEHFVQEELRLDPRVERYSQSSTSADLPMDDEVFELLRIMRDRVRSRRQLRAVGGGDVHGEAGTGSPWTPQRRLQVRLFNVLNRWCGALNDPRLRWVHPFAPVRNYIQLQSALYECWINEFLPPPRIVKLIETLFGSFIRTDRANGYLLAISDEDRHRALESVSEQARTYAAALVYAGLRQEPGIPTFIFDWQPFLVHGMKLELFEVDAETADLAQTLLGTGSSDKFTHTDVSPVDIDDHLQKSASYINDQRFCEVLARELGFEDVELPQVDVNDRFDVSLRIIGNLDPLEDPRTITAIRRTFEYRNVRNMILITDVGRLSIRLGNRVFARIDGIDYESITNVTGTVLRDLEQRGLGLGSILSESSAIAS